MKKLFVVRHAKSSWDFPELDDFDRPLNKRGKKSAPEMGKRLAKRGVKPDAMITSSAKRALSTARQIAKALLFPKSEIAKEDQFYHGSNQDVIEILQNVDDKISTLMIFGHNPGLTDLVNYLSDSNVYNIPTCGVAEIDFEISTWKLLGKQKGKLVKFDFPKKVSADQV
jgi:phosphohistidine phosphatase